MKGSVDMRLLQTIVSSVPLLVLAVFYLCSDSNDGAVPFCDGRLCMTVHGQLRVATEVARLWINATIRLQPGS